MPLNTVHVYCTTYILQRRGVRDLRTPLVVVVVGGGGGGGVCVCVCVCVSVCVCDDVSYTHHLLRDCISQGSSIGLCVYSYVV